MPEAPVVEEVAPDSPEAVVVIGRYLDELVARFPPGFDPGDRSFSGRYFVIRGAADPSAGCGFRVLADGRAEVKRLWVDPATRGAGLGRAILAHVEAVARAEGHDEVVLDTHGALVEAIAMYDRLGYRRIDRYNDNPHAQLFFAKRLG